MQVIDPGHVYLLEGLGGGDQTLTFIKRSSEAIEYDEEWPGLQTQEVLRALIDRTEYLYRIMPCLETKDAAYHLRMALYKYELRAWRRKQEAVNRTALKHDDSGHEHTHEAPFNEQEIERRPVGPDGHIRLESDQP